MYYCNAHNSDACIELTKWGIKKASVFPGFCQNHDGLLFNRIDCPIDTFDKEVLLSSCSQVILHAIALGIKARRA